MGKRDVMNEYSQENLKRRINLTLVHMRSSYRNGHFVITETLYPIEKVNRSNLRYNEVFDNRISHLNTIIADKLAFGCYEVFVIKCDDDNSDVIKYRHKLATSTFADLKMRLNSISTDIAGVVKYIESHEYEND